MKTLNTIELIKSLILTAVVGCLTLTVETHAGTILWTNTTSGSWDTAADWSPNVVPGTNDTAIITNAGVTVTLTGSAGAGAIILGNSGAGTVALSLAGQTLLLNGTMTVNSSGSFTVDSGTLYGYPNAVLSGALGWSGGALSGILTLAAGSTLNLSTPNNHDLNGTVLTNNGTVVWNDGRIRVGSGAAIFNYGSWIRHRLRRCGGGDNRRVAQLWCL